MSYLFEKIRICTSEIFTVCMMLFDLASHVQKSKALVNRQTHCKQTEAGTNSVWFTLLLLGCELNSQQKFACNLNKVNSALYEQ